VSTRLNFLRPFYDFFNFVPFWRCSSSCSGGTPVLDSLSLPRYPLGPNVFFVISLSLTTPPKKFFSLAIWSGMNHGGRFFFSLPSFQHRRPFCTVDLTLFNGPSCNPSFQDRAFFFSLSLPPDQLWFPTNRVFPGSFPLCASEGWTVRGHQYFKQVVIRLAAAQQNVRRPGRPMVLEQQNSLFSPVLAIR